MAAWIVGGAALLGLRWLLKGKKQIDLHGLHAQEAKEKVKEFLEKAEKDYKSWITRGERYVYIITGRGKHSENHYPVLKNVATDILNESGFSYKVQAYGGMLEVDLSR